MTSNNADIRRLPLSTSSFVALRRNNQIYVDKTELIFRFASLSKKFLLTRPRRFGKSLLISTLESLFKYGIRDFKDLAIEKLWKDEKTYKVVKLDFSEISNFNSFAQFSSDLAQFLVAQFSQAGFIYDKDSLLSVNQQLSEWLQSQKPTSLVLLIDEYDAPLTACLNDKEAFEKVGNELAAFYPLINANDEVFRFVFMTGITRLMHGHILSQLDNLTDLSLCEEYDTLVGFTEEEIKKYFEPFLMEAQRELNLCRAELMEELDLNYDGFCFGQDARSHVFAPWSVLKFFTAPKTGFSDYWVQSGSRLSSLLRSFPSGILSKPEEFGKEKTIPLQFLSSSSDLADLSETALLTESGYLTVKKVVGTTAIVGYPNHEVKKAIAELYTKLLLKGKTVEQVGGCNIVERLSEGNAKTVFELLNLLFPSIDYQSYPIRDEATLRGFVQVFLSGAGLYPKVETHNHKERCDIIVRAGKWYWVFEFKMISDHDRREQASCLAAEQMVSRHYGLAGPSEDIKRVVLIFSLDKREFVDWIEVE